MTDHTAEHGTSRADILRWPSDPLDTLPWWLESAAVPVTSIPTLLTVYHSWTAETRAGSSLQGVVGCCPAKAKPARFGP